MALLAVILVWRNQTSSLLSMDSIGTPRKRASRNSCKNVSAIQRPDQKLWLFQLLFYSGTTRPPLQRRVIPLVTKVMACLNCYSGLACQDYLFNEQGFHRFYNETASENNCKTLSVIQRLDQKSKVNACFSSYSILAWQDLLFNE